LKLHEFQAPALPEQRAAEPERQSATIYQAVAAADVERLHFLKELAMDLADQRLYVTEQCERLLRAQQRWQQESERQAQLLQERQSAVAAGERSLAVEQSRLHSLRREIELL